MPCMQRQDCWLQRMQREGIHHRMNIRITHYIYAEDWDFESVFRRAGYAHDVDVARFEHEFWDHGESREIPVELEIDTETGVITVVGQETS